eukprot:TRINITY_DN3446_c0_g3_i3.p1 TRINITY_DN3446_c0_g3~~TRINITY_DN3446_c0_g3_i3.p1  ORF type:complete len:536 (-),score=130.73 TRINITY_DN3446_c0_g3_i3:28-1605(-)
MSELIEAVYLGQYSEVINITAEKKKKNEFEALISSEGEENEVAKEVPNPVQETDENGDTPLHIAASQGNLLLVRYLLTQGAIVNATNKAGSTPLHKAALSGIEGIYNFLLENKADPDIKNKVGFYPEDYARENRTLFRNLLGKKFVTEEIEIPQVHHASLIGKQGRQITLIRIDTGVETSVPPQKENSTKIKLIGRAENISLAKELINSIVKEREAYNTVNPSKEKPSEKSDDTPAQPASKAVMNVPLEKHKLVLSRVKNIVSSTGVKISIPKIEEKLETITITGPMENITKAIQMINKLIKGQEKPRRDWNGIVGGAPKSNSPKGSRENRPSDNSSGRSDTYNNPSHERNKETQRPNPKDRSTNNNNNNNNNRDRSASSPQHYDNRNGQPNHDRYPGHNKGSRNNNAAPRKGGGIGRGSKIDPNNLLNFKYEDTEALKARIKSRKEEAEKKKKEEEANKDGRATEEKSKDIIDSPTTKKEAVVAVVKSPTDTASSPKVPKQPAPEFRLEKESFPSLGGLSLIHI